jgi:DNA-binding transcriptional LysR family regulator
MDRLRLYEVFIRIVERGSLSAASRDLRLPQPTVSRLLKTLETQLDARLIERTTHRMNLTEQGALLYERARHLIEEFESVESSVRSTQAQLVGSLSVNAPVLFGEDVLAQLLADFQQEHPELEVALQLNDRRIDMIEEGVDLAIRFGEVGVENLVAHKLALANRIMIASPSYVAKHGSPRRPEDLAHHNVLLYGFYDDAQTLELWKKDKSVAIPVKGNFRCSNGRALINLYELGHGIGEAVEFSVHKSIEGKQLEQILKQWQRKPMLIHALHPPGRYVKPKVRTLIAYLQTHLPKLPGFMRHAT